jgi:hypothetical protein
MFHRTSGLTFIAIGAFLYAVQYLAAAILMSNVNTWSAERFDTMRGYVGVEPLVIASASGLLGGWILFRVWWLGPSQS